MKYLFLSFSALFIFCNKKTNKPRQTIKYNEFFSVALNDKAFIAIKPDTVAYISDYDSTANESSGRFVLLTIHSGIDQKNITPKMVSNSIIRKEVIPQLKYYPIYIDDVINQDTKNIDVDIATLKNLKKTNIDTNNLIIRRFGDSLFYAKKGRASEMYLLNTHTGNISQIDFKFSMENVKLFFVYDINNDKIPEIFILSDASIHRKEKVMTFFIYSIVMQ